MSNQARVLLLCDDRPGNANTILDHINAFLRFSRHDVRTFNPRQVRTSWFLDLDQFDVVVVHYSVVLSHSVYMAAGLREKLRRFQGLKVQFLQDDYRWVDQATAASRDVGIKVLFTVAPEPAARQMYDGRLPGVRRILTLTGYVPDNLVHRRVQPLAERSVDVGYRARDLPFWYGRLSREKAWIGQRFSEMAVPYGLRCDIGWKENQRLYGDDWIDFVASSRATLGCESGASIADFDGSIERGVRAYLRAHPGAMYEEVHEAVLKPYEGNVVVHVISPRVFEAAALGTALIMFPGEYSGVVKPDLHYIPLEKDFSNMDEVVARLRDDAQMAAMTERAREDLVLSGRWSYQRFIEDFDHVIDEEAVTRARSSSIYGWKLAQAERAMRVPGFRVRAIRLALGAWRRVRALDRSARFAVDYDSQIEKGLFTIRTAVADRELRPLLGAGRRARAPLDRLLREIMELSLLRDAARGGLRTDQVFALTREYDPGRKALCFVSSAPGEGRPENHDSTEVDGALRGGELSVIEWDHRALGGKIRLQRPAMEVGIGYEGLESFTVLAGIGRSNPALLERALAPVIHGTGAGRRADSVG
jgi:hypothetical protein